MNALLGQSYQRLWNIADCLLYLQVPDMAAVRDWRARQEMALPAARRMGPHELEVFLAHYARLTQWMFDPLPGRADMVVELGRDHRITRVHRNF